MKYRDFMSLTDDEIKFIVNDIFQPKSIGAIERIEEWEEIEVAIVTEWGNDEFGVEEIEDIIGLRENIIYSDFEILYEDLFKWRQFLLAKGCNELLKDNRYLIQ